MPVHERRKHVRIDDHIYMDYRIIQPGDHRSDLLLNSKKYMLAVQFFKEIDHELSSLTQTIAIKEPAIAHYLNLLNTKIDYLSRHMLLTDQVQIHKVNLSLGGITFKTNEPVKIKSKLQIIIYTKPMMLPVIIDAIVVNCLFQSETHYQTSVLFNKLNNEQELLLSQHILADQVKNNAD